MADEQRIEELSAAVRYHRELYYNHSAPEISDADFDKLWDELKLLDPNNSVSVSYTHLTLPTICSV